jgi:hypothetical protein
VSVEQAQNGVLDPGDAKAAKRVLQPRTQGLAGLVQQVNGAGSQPAHKRLPEAAKAVKNACGLTR